MRRFTLVALLSIVALASALAAAPAALAEETACRGAIGARTVDNLRVPDSAACALTGTSVKGTITVERNARLDASRVRVVGNVQAENHRFVSLTGSTVGGSVQFDQGGAFKVVDTDVEGSIQVTSNGGRSRLKANTVNQDVQVFGHRNGIAVADNRIDGNLQCKENSPAPTGGGNRVGGNKEDQCRRL